MHRTGSHNTLYDVDTVSLPVLHGSVALVVWGQTLPLPLCFALVGPRESAHWPLLAPGPVPVMALSFLTSAVPPTRKNCGSIDVRGPEGDNGKTDVFCSDIVKYRRYSMQRKNIYVSIQLV